jgi:hypothetical protein
MGLKRWERALEFLTFVIAAPTIGPASTIQVEAYKKWVLIGLLYYGGVSLHFRNAKAEETSCHT